MRRSLRILLVDQESETRKPLEHGLSAMGLLVTACPGEQQALGLCFSGAFDAVVVDVALLVEGDMRLTRRLREHVPYKSLPILGLKKPGAPEVGPGSGLDQIIPYQDDPRDLYHAVHRLRQQRGLLASAESSPQNRHRS